MTWARAAVLVLLLTLGAAACGAPRSQDRTDTIEMTFGEYLAPGHPTRVAWSEPFMERLEELAEEDPVVDVDITYYGGGELVGASDTFDAVIDGVVDLGPVVTNYMVDYIPIAGIAEVPGSLQSDAVQGSQALMQFLDEYALEDFSEHNLRPIMAYALDPYNLVTADEPVEEPSDMSGQVIRGGGGALNQGLQALGATPVEMSVSDAYLALDRGIIDGTSLGSVSVLSSRLFEVASYMTRNLKLGAASLLYLVNEDWWDGLTPRAQDLVQQAAADVQAEAPYEVRALEQESFDQLADEGMEIYDVPDPEAWESELADQPENWVEKLDDAGHDGDELLAAWERLLSQAGDESAQDGNEAGR